MTAHQAMPVVVTIMVATPRRNLPGLRRLAAATMGVDIPLDLIEVPEALDEDGQLLVSYQADADGFRTDLQARLTAACAAFNRTTEESDHA